MNIKECYITDTCFIEFKDMDGEIYQRVGNVDNTFECGDDEKGADEIIDEDMENSGSILEDSQYYLINYGVV